MHIYDISTVVTESDVEQKVIYPILTNCLGYDPGDICTKKYIQDIFIGKRKSKRGYYPDYIVFVDAIPVIVIEAKPPSDCIADGFKEAAMYAGELNRFYDENINPVKLVICCNGKEFVCGHWDSAINVLELSSSDFASPTEKYNNFVYLN